MKKIEIFSVLKTVELTSSEYQTDKKNHGGVEILVDNLLDEKLKNQLKLIMKQYNYSMIVGRLID